MRKTFAGLVALSIATAVPAFAQTRGASLSGQIVDVAGHGSSSSRLVELVSDGVIVGTTMSGYDGRFTFAVGSPGTYIVRTIANGHPAGIRVAVTKGQPIPMALIVLPSVGVPSPQIGAAISGGVSALTSISAVAASQVATQLATNVTKKNDDEILADPQTQQDVVNVLRQIIAEVTHVPLAQIPPATTLAGLGNVIANIPVVQGSIPLPAELTTAITTIVTNTPTGSGSGH